MGMFNIKEDGIIIYIYIYIYIMRVCVCLISFLGADSFLS